MTDAAQGPGRVGADRGLVPLIGGAGALGGALATLPLLPPLSAALGLAGLGLALAARGSARARRVRLPASLVAVLSATSLVVSLGLSSAMTVSVRPGEPGIPASPIPDPRD